MTPSPIIEDNQWHDGVIYSATVAGKEGLALANSFDEALLDETAIREDNGLMKWARVLYNWNHGQPIFDMGAFKCMATNVRPSE